MQQIKEKTVKQTENEEKMRKMKKSNKKYIEKISLSK